MTAWLRGLGAAGLTSLLAERPDACTAPAPGTLAELAGRLAARPSVQRALETVDSGTLALTEVLAGLDRPTRAELGRYVGEGDTTTTGALENSLGLLRARALVWEETDSDGTTRLRAAGALAGLWGHPLGLGTPMRALLARLQPDVLHVVVGTLGVGAGPSRSVTHGRVVSHLTPARIRAIVTDAPADVRDLLERVVADGPDLMLGPELAMGLYAVGRQPDRGIVWAVRRALLLPVAWDSVELPREVGLALRGEEWTVPVRLTRPPLQTSARGRDAVVREGGARASAFTDLAAAVAESLATRPADELRAGGLGVREVRRLAKATASPEPDVVLALELAAVAGLLRREGGRVLATDDYDRWRGAAAVDRFLPLLDAWWTATTAVTERTDRLSGKAVAPLGWLREREDVRRLREAMVSFLAGLPQGESLPHLDALLEQVTWASPLRFPTRADLAEQGAAIWREAETLGVAVAGAVTPVGAALAAGDRPALVTAMAAALPPTSSAVLFQADLTAVVTGTPPGSLADLLDSAADREGRGNASTWRFSPDSVRAFLDAGGIAKHLVEELGIFAAHGLPQPLAYLIADVTRRHGRVSVRPVACVVVSPDIALLAEVAGTRSLASLRLAQIAPTVLASDRPVAETLTMLRAAGFAPARLTSSGEVSVERAATPRAVTELASRRGGAATRRLGRPVPHRPVRPSEPPVDPAALAAALLSAPDSLSGSAVELPEPASLTVARLREHGRNLAVHELAVLAHAIDSGGAAHITYRDANGRDTERVISDITLFAPFIEAWCHLRDDERMFTISGIGSVSPA